MTPRRAGFSLAEALVVLAITSVLLVLLASISTGASRAGFRTSARAGTASERLLGVEALRTLLRGVRLPEHGASDAPFSGDAGGFTAAVTAGRPTPCGPGAPAAALALRLERTGGRTRLVCASAGGPSAVVLDLGDAAAGFTYALAGRPWSDRLTAHLPPPRPGAAPGRAARSHLWIRLRAPPDVEVIEAADPPPASRAAA